MVSAQRTTNCSPGLAPSLVFAGLAFVSSNSKRPKRNANLLARLQEKQLKAKAKLAQVPVTHKATRQRLERTWKDAADKAKQHKLASGKLSQVSPTN